MQPDFRYIFLNFGKNRWYSFICLQKSTQFSFTGSDERVQRILKDTETEGYPLCMFIIQSPNFVQNEFRLDLQNEVRCFDFEYVQRSIFQF